MEKFKFRYALYRTEQHSNIDIVLCSVGIVERVCRFNLIILILFNINVS